MVEAKLKYPVHKIGRVLRSFRERTSRKLSDVAAIAGISTSMLSQIERGVVSPSIDTLFAVCAALGLESRDLFSMLSPPARVRIIASANHLQLEKQGIKYEQIVTSADRSYPAEMFLLEVQPGEQVGISGQSHEGVELGYVLSGEATVTVDGADYLLKQGDGVSFSSHLPHRLVNSGRGLFRAVWTVMPPHKDYLDLGTDAARVQDGAE